ncbi:hypothetical protein HMPREF0004_0276 [Achromobacter piechaudii ATCC 43553]|uniref:Uncharacterized protein n=1 Tax=Achromobacter piechaudii ATCC 43553 TaxID=742159 RepID=D4X479_9BURK|nr:hypothetical protein HMPREF0004_0276 [Achromobacter piechaudii ATCC 43553]
MIQIIKVSGQEANVPTPLCRPFHISMQSVNYPNLAALNHGN